MTKLDDGSRLELDLVILAVLANKKWRGTNSLLKVREFHTL